MIFFSYTFSIMFKKTLFFLFISVVVFSQNEKQQWVDSTYAAMTVDEKIGQLFMVATYTNKSESHLNEIEKLVTDYKIGGLIFFQGGPLAQVKATNRLQSKAKLPLFVGIDAEWGLAMRLDSTPKYPWNMTLGAIRDLKLIEKTGFQIAEQAKRMGIHFTFGPVVDINTNPNNPIIGTRSYGEDKYNVAQKGVAFIKGLQGNGIFANAKHFPGHGDTASDSHKSLPSITFSKERIEEIELYPYRELIKNGLASVMVAHLDVPSLESKKGYPSSISKSIVTDLLIDQMGFEGLIFTDALNMKGASNFKSPGDIDLAAFLAGNDILLFSENVPLAIKKIKKAFQKKTITEERLAHSVKKILAYKYSAGLHTFKPISTDNLNLDLNTNNYKKHIADLYKNAITTLKNENEIIPINFNENQHIAYIKLGDSDHDAFFGCIDDYAKKVTYFDESSINDFKLQKDTFTKVIIGYHKIDNAWKNHDFSNSQLNLIKEIAAEKETILTLFTKPYSLLNSATYLGNVKAIVLAYQNNNEAQTAAAEVLFGAISSKGHLPVSIEGIADVNFGIATYAKNTLGFGTPLEVGMNESVLAEIDPIIEEAIRKKYTPGAQILVAKSGKIVFQKSYGYHTFNNNRKVENTDLYDVASLTKILGTLPVLMQLYDEGKFRLDTKLKTLLSQFANTDKANLKVIDILSHQARLYPWIPFYKTTLDAFGKPDAKFYRSAYSEEFPTQVADNLFLVKDYEKVMLQEIGESELLSSKKYKYSDLAFFLMKAYIEKETGKTLDELAYTHFYKKMGATRITYNPLQKFSANEIPPTEEDNYFRYQKIQGFVHDMGAAMQGGVGGHAGLFANAEDVAKMMQLYLQKGKYGDQTYFSEKTFNDFNTCYFCPKDNRRGVGFDKPQLGESGPTCGCVPMTSFGHTGFTGTMAWADPENELIYIFLSNRTYPHATTNDLSRANIREDIQAVIYKSLQ